MPFSILVSDLVSAWLITSGVFTPIERSIPSAMSTRRLPAPDTLADLRRPFTTISGPVMLSALLVF
jgi:hypothetical protein